MTRTGYRLSFIEMLAREMEVELLEGELDAVADHGGPGRHDDLDGSAQVLELGLGNVGDVELDRGPGDQGELAVGHVDGALPRARGTQHVGDRIE